MGVNANFVAEFSTFLSAINAADVALADFGKGADTVGKKLNDMVDKFSGRQIIQQANELVIAIDKVHGVTALTTNEQIKLNATLQEAIAKYQAIGETVPPEMQKLADATKATATAAKEAQTNTSSWESTLTSWASAAAAAFSVNAIVQYIGKLVEGASALNTLSAQTHINVEDLQILTAATASYGVSSEELGRALFSLQNRIAGGDASVVSAYAAMGIKIDDLKDKNASDLFLTTERALGQLTGGIRDAAAADLYGGKLGASMAAFSTGVDKAVDDAKRLNKITSQESVAAMAEYGDAIKRTQTSIDAFVTEGLGKLAQGFNVLNKATNDGASKWDLFVATFKDMTGLSGNLTKLLDETNKKTEASAKAATDAAKAHGEVKVALDARGQAAQFMGAMEANAVAPLLDYQKTYLAQLDAMGQLNAQNAARIGVSVTQLEAYKKGLEAAKKATDDLVHAQEEADKIALDQYAKRIRQLEAITQANLKAYSFDGQIAQLNLLIAAEEATAKAVYDQITSEKDRMKIIEDLATRRTTIANQMMALEQKHAGVVNEQVIAELEAQGKLEAAYGRNVDGTVKVETAQTKLQIALDALHQKKQEGISQYNQEQLLMDQFLKDQEAEVAAVQQSTAAEDGHTQALKRNKDAVAELHGQFTALVTDQTIPAFFGQMTGYASVASTVLAGGRHTAGEAAYIAAGGIISGPIGGLSTRAAGGPVDAGTPYLVGERGPELFVPTASGSIAANGAGVTVHNTFNIVDTEANIARRVADQITRSVMRGSRLS